MPILSDSFAKAIWPGAEKPFDYEDRLRKLKLVLDYNEGELARARARIENTQKILEGIEELLNSRIGYNYGDNDE